MRCLLVLAATFLTGCTVGWLDLRKIDAAEAAWNCPSSAAVTYSRANFTNTFGANQADSKHNQEMARRYELIAKEVLNELGCSTAGQGSPLVVKIEQVQYLSALPQEWLTGLSFGLIPSWGTRPAEAQFTFEHGEKSAVCVVDDTRINHLVLFPVFWVSFLLVDYEREFRQALRDYAKAP